MDKEMYCEVCNLITPHKYRGRQEGVPGKHLDIYDCLACKDTCGRWRDDVKAKPDKDFEDYEADWWANNQPEDPRTWSDEDMGLAERVSQKSHNA